MFVLGIPRKFQGKRCNYNNIVKKLSFLATPRDGLYAKRCQSALNEKRQLDTTHTSKNMIHGFSLDVSFSSHVKRVIRAIWLVYIINLLCSFLLCKSQYVYNKLTYHWAATKEVIAICYCHDSSTALPITRNCTIAVKSWYGNCVYTVYIAIECTAVFHHWSPIACGKYIDWSKTPTTLQNEPKKKHIC